MSMPYRDGWAPPLNLHELKTWPEPFQAIWTGEKRFEVRKDDRGFEVGDLLVLREWVPETELYTTRRALAYVTYIARGPNWGLLEGHVVMSLGQVQQSWLEDEDRPCAAKKEGT